MIGGSVGRGLPLCAFRRQIGSFNLAGHDANFANLPDMLRKPE